MGRLRDLLRLSRSRLILKHDEELLYFAPLMLYRVCLLCFLDLVVGVETPVSL